MSFRKEIKHIVIAGAGIMGASLAQMFAQNDYTVMLYDISDEGIQKGQELITINQETFVKEGTITEEKSKDIISKITYSKDINCFKAADYVIEAIIENMDIKKKFWKSVSEITDKDIVLTSNTSGLSITEMATAVEIPERFVGMHFVNPPHIVPLVEVISGDKTDKEAAEIVRDVALSAHRKPVMVNKDVKGFVLNRLQYAVLREAIYIVENGIATMEDVDNVMKYGLGMRYAAIGPFETVDLGGLDTFYNISKYLFRDLSDEKETPKLLEERYLQGAYGTKTGKGFYDYSGGRDKEVIAKRDRDFLKLADCLFKDL